MSKACVCSLFNRTKSYLFHTNLYTKRLRKPYLLSQYKYELSTRTRIKFIQKRHFELSHAILCNNKSENVKKELMPIGYFIEENKSKETFIEAINMYKTREKHLRGHVEFILTALKHLEEYGVHRELSVYKELLNIMPKGKMIPRNIWQMEFFHYPKHQDCAMAVLDEMAIQGVMPDTEVYHILRNTFGEWGGPTKMLKRILYWLPKIKNASPWPLPATLPADITELSKLAIQQITSVDPATKVTVMQTSSVKDAIDDTWIVNGISPSQIDLLKNHPPSKSIKVEGPFGVYIHDQKVAYFILRGEPEATKPPLTEDDADKISSIFSWITEEKPVNEEVEIIKKQSVHEQEDGTIYAVCATGTSSRDSLLSWIRLLEETNPSLSDIVVLFTQSSPIGHVIVTSESEEAPFGDSSS